MSDGFQFKHFFIRHDQCAMKVNTDGILLGAIAPIKNCSHILDLGTGTGLVAIMLAQRTDNDCQIYAIELEPNAYQQAVKNAQFSAWSNRIHMIHGDVMKQSLEPQFDLIVSNPPYFEDSLESKTKARGMARTITNQTHLDWLKQAKKGLKEDGCITLILPSTAAEKLILQSHIIGLYCTEKWEILTKIGKTAKRMIVNFSLQEKACEQKRLIIYDEQNQYTPEFKALTKSFYLNF